MTRLERTIAVAWRHQVIFSDDVFARFNPALRDVLVNGEPRRPARALVVLEEAVARARPGLAAEIGAYFAAHAPALELVAPPVVIEGGERVKNAYFHVSEVHAHLDRHHIDRHSYLAAVGGGALLDMAGLAAATAHRGVRHVRIPTTVLAQADSGVGVKNGINAFGKKNFIGTFAPPFAVLNDFALLATLPDRDRRAGCVEAVKVACIRDAVFFAELERDAAALARFEEAPLRRLIRRCAELHLDHIATGGDPFETGSARPLDFGHWAAHKLEQLSEFRLRHGEAVAIGIALDVIYARNTGLLPAPAAERVLGLLEALGFDLYTAELHYEDSAGRLLVLGGLEEFREHLGGELTITLLRDLGVGVEVHAMNVPQVVRAMAELRARHEARSRARDATAAA